MSPATEKAEQWQPPIEGMGRIPLVVPGKSGDKPIDGDFPLDQVVIDRMFEVDYAVNSKSLIMERVSSGHSSPQLRPIWRICVDCDCAD